MNKRPLPEGSNAYPPPPLLKGSHAYPPPQEGSHAYPPPPPPPQDFVFKHPFTANVSGPTSCGKSKDPRINELFTEGSHHRNLSVIAINQNLYYNKDPTQRRNCHYLVLFNNPIDKQQVMTLARQMYPENVQHLMMHFKQAISKPYGYLLVDLKPSTPESLRMRGDIFSMQPIKGQKDQANAHFEADTPTEQTYFQQQRQHLEEHQPQEDMPACDDCGIMFQDIHDLQRHLKTWCPENDSRKRKRESIDEEEPKSKRWIPFEEIESEDDTIKSEENEVFKSLMNEAESSNEDKWNQKYEKYVNEGMSDDEAQTKANEKMDSEDMKQFYQNYKAIIQYIIQLRNGKIHKQIMDDVTEFIEDGYGDSKAIKMALKKNRHVLEELWDDDSEDAGSDDDSEDEKSDDDSEADEN